MNNLINKHIFEGNNPEFDISKPQHYHQLWDHLEALGFEIELYDNKESTYCLLKFEGEDVLISHERIPQAKNIKQAVALAALKAAEAINPGSIDWNEVLLSWDLLPSYH